MVMARAQTLDWISTRTMAAAIAQVHEHLPRDLAAIASGYLNDRRGIEAISDTTFYSPIRQITIDTDQELSTHGYGRLISRNIVTVLFANGQDYSRLICTHCITWEDEAIWDFACGEDAPMLVEVLRLHTCDDYQLAEWVNNARRRLRKDIIGYREWLVDIGRTKN
jgi:hypothetical protein